MSIKVSNRLIDLFPFKKINKFSPIVTTTNSAKFLLSKNLKDWYTYDPSKTGIDAWMLITSKDLRNVPEDEARSEILKSTLDLSTIRILDWNVFKDFWNAENEDPNMLGVAYTFDDVSKFLDIKNFEFDYDLKGDYKDVIIPKRLNNSFNNFKISGIFDFFEDGSEVSMYEFKGNVDDTGGNYNGVWNGTESYIPSKFGQGANFDGNGYIEIPSNFGFSESTNEMSISAWFKSTQTDNEGVIISINSSNGSLIAISLKQSVFFNDTSDNAFVNNFDYAYSDGNWHHIVLVVKDNNKLLCYMDNNLISTSTNKTFIGKDKHATNVTNLGYQTSAYPHELIGTIAQVHIFNKALIDSEVQKLYNEI